jgi:hypothetical protein
MTAAKGKRPRDPAPLLPLRVLESARLNGRKGLVASRNDGSQQAGSIGPRTQGLRTVRIRASRSFGESKEHIAGFRQEGLRAGSETAKAIT